jgi:Predicted endonuclease containing a URI domain
MFYVYILKSDTNTELYIGCTNNLQRRVEEHNSGSVSSTKKYIPYKLIHYEAFLNKHDAFAREQYLKSGWGKKFLKKNLYHYFHN